MALPPALEHFSRLPIWNVVFLLLALAVIVYSIIAYRKTRHRQEIYYLIMGVYLAIVQLPIVAPDLLGPQNPGNALAGSGMSFLLAVPAVVLFVLGVRAQ